MPNDAALEALSAAADAYADAWHTANFGAPRPKPTPVDPAQPIPLQLGRNAGKEAA
jgi:hypothetical protein